MQSVRFVFCLLLSCIGPMAIHVNVATALQPTQPNLEGEWLLDSAQIRQQDRLDQVWSSLVSISSNCFTVSNFLDPSKELKGKIHFDESSPNQLDVELDELDFSSLGEPVKIEASTLKGIIQVESADAITVAVGLDPTRNRPNSFESTSSVLVFRLLRAPRDFKGYPKEVTIHVESVDGKPVEGAVAARFQAKHLKGDLPDVARTYSGEKKTDSDGNVVFPYGELPRLVFDEKTKQVAFPKISPASLVDGRVNVRLGPACEVKGTITCKELEQTGQKLGWTNVYLEAHGTAVADCSSRNGEFDFLVPAGEYKLEVYGGKVSGRRIGFAVSRDQQNASVGPVELKALAFALLKGKPAPEFIDVSGWSGAPVKIADLKGKFVLVDFWGYWCGPCVEAMPVLIELHHKYSDKGLAIIGVHADANGEIDSEEKLKEKTKQFVDSIWKGNELPFPSALVSGKPIGDDESRQRRGTMQLYGVEAFPTTILIDREGNVVEQFPMRDLKHATERIEKLLGIDGK